MTPIDQLERDMQTMRNAGNHRTPVHNHILTRLIAAYRELQKSNRTFPRLVHAAEPKRVEIAE